MDTNVELIGSTRVDNLNIRVCKNRVDLGIVSGQDIKEKINEILSVRKEIRIVFASAPSQEETLKFLRNTEGIDWSRIHVFDMDEYIGLSGDQQGSFSQYLNSQLFTKVNPGRVDLIDGMNDPEKECKRYAQLLLESPIDIVVLGLGENGHVAFNEPDVADFNDKEIVKVVTLNEKSRWQQVHDGCFSSIDEVPKRALTITVPVIFSGSHLFCLTPGSSKRDAVTSVISGPVSEDVPGTVLRRHNDCTLYVDTNSYSIE